MLFRSSRTRPTTWNRRRIKKDRWGSQRSFLAETRFCGERSRRKCRKSADFPARQAAGRSKKKNSKPPGRCSMCMRRPSFHGHPLFSLAERGERRPFRPFSQKSFLPFRPLCKDDTKLHYPLAKCRMRGYTIAKSTEQIHMMIYGGHHGQTA